MYYSLKRISLSLLLMLPLIGLAQDFFIREINHAVNSDLPTHKARVEAVEEIKRILLDELGTYIESETQYRVTEDGKSFQEEFVQTTKSYSQTLMRTKILEEKRIPNSMYMKVSIELDANELSSSLRNAGMGDQNDILNIVFNLLEANNVVSVSPLVTDCTNKLLQNLKIMEEQQSALRIYDVRKNFQGQILDGSSPINGYYTIIYNSSMYAELGITDGYANDTFRLYDRNSQLFEKGFYVDNKKEGVWYYYDKERNGFFLKNTISYKNGLRNGNSTQYRSYPKGQLLKVTQYENDVAIFEEEYEFRVGNVNKGPLDKLGKKHGLWIYTEGDEVISKVNYSHGLKYGLFITHYVGGQVKRKGEYVNDHYVGHYVSYFANGQLHEEEYYDQKGHSIGTNHEYYKNGEFKSVITYNKIGGQHNEYYYDNGQLKEECTYINDFDKHGDYRKYYEDGQLKEESEYLNGEQTGKHRRYFEDGDLKWETTYAIIDKRSVKHGPYKSYRRDKTLDIVCFYRNNSYDELYTSYFKGERSRETFYKDTYLLWTKDYYPNGELRSDSEYPENGEPSTEKHYYDNGQLKLLQHNLAGKNRGQFYKKTGVFERYSESGHLTAHCNYIDDKVEGLYVKYTSEGKLQSKTYWVGNNRNGLSVHYTDGEIYQIGEYVNGRKNGKWLRFHNGDEVREITYDMDAEVADKTYNNTNAKVKALKRAEAMK